MKKYILCICFIIIIALSFSGCFSLFSSTSNRYMDDESNITSIEVVKLGEFNQNNYKFNEESVLFKVENLKQFCEDFSKVSRSTNNGDPRSLYTGDIVIKIVYSNENYELISFTAQSRYYTERHRNGYNFFNEDEFKALISKYAQIAGVCDPYN